MKRRKYHQTEDDRMDESLGERHRGHHEQSFKDRRHEEEGMDKKYHHHMAHAHHSYLAHKHKKRAH